MTLLFVGMVNAEDDHVQYKFQYYEDNNEVQVITNAATISKSLGEHVNLGVSYLIDGITGASRVDDRGKAIDGVTAASETDEKRQEVKGSVQLKFDVGAWFNTEKESEDPTFVSITGINSAETDYTSRTVSASVSQDLFQRNTTLATSYTKSFDDFDPAERFRHAVAKGDGWNYFGEGKRQTDKYSVSITQGITTKTLASLIWGYTFDRGYLSRPYYVYQLTNETWVHENLPTERKAMTYTLRVNQFIPTKNGSSIHFDYRFYNDSWELLSHTINLKYYWRFAEFFIVRPSYRFYTQNSAFFYKDKYPSSHKSYVTTDFKYRECMTHAVGLKLIYELRDFFEPEDSPFMSLFPTAIDVAGNYMMRTGTTDEAVIRSHYNYWTDQYQNFWIQAGLKFAF